MKYKLRSIIILLPLNKNKMTEIERHILTTLKEMGNEINFIKEELKNINHKLGIKNRKAEQLAVLKNRFLPPFDIKSIMINPVEKAIANTIENLCISVQECDFSVKAYNVFREAKCKYLADVVICGGDFHKRRNMGIKSIKEIELVLKNYGLKFRHNSSF